MKVYLVFSVTRDKPNNNKSAHLYISYSHYRLVSDSQCNEKSGDYIISYTYIAHYYSTDRVI